MEVNNLNLGNQISIATLKLAQDQLKVKGDAAVQLIEGAAAVATAASSGTGAVGAVVDVKV